MIRLRRNAPVTMRHIRAEMQFCNEFGLLLVGVIPSDIIGGNYVGELFLLENILRKMRFR